MFSKEAKEFIIREVTNEKGRLNEYVIDKVENKIYCLECAIKVSEHLERLNNLKNSIVDQLNQIAVDPSKLNLDTLQKVPQFLEIFIYLTDKDLYNSIQGYKPINEDNKLTSQELKKEQALMNSPSIPEGLCKIKIIDEDISNKLKSNSKNIDFYKNLSNEMKAYMDVYYLRNQGAHADRDLSITQKWQYVKDILIIYLEVAGRFRKELESELNRIDLSSATDAEKYMNNIIKKYEDRTCFTYINLEGKEKQSSTSENNKSKTSLINLISKNNNCRIKLLGNAGMGKTTTMEYLAYQDAKNYNGRVPVFIELKDINNEQNTIIKIIANKEHLNCQEDIVEKLLTNGYINLYLDGINEITMDNNQKRQIISQINALFALYPKIKIILTDRESNNITVTDNVDTYVIEKLTDNKIDEFIRKNSKSKEVELKALDLIFKNTDASNNLKELVRIPFRLYKLLEIINMDITIPTTVEEFDKYFTDAIIEREVRLKATPEARNLTYFIKEILNINKEIFEREELIEIISNAINKRNLTNENSDKLIDLFTELSIMEEVSFNKYRFINSEIRQNRKEENEEKANEISW